MMDSQMPGMMDSHSRMLLLDQVRQGNRAALGHLLDDLRPYIRVIVHGQRHGQLAKSNEDSDLIQEALMQAMQSIETFDGTTLGEWLAWLRTITVRTTYRMRRSTNPQLIGESSDWDLATLITDQEPAAHAHLIRNEMADRMALALARLPDDMQQVLLGRLVDELDHSELAQQLGRSTGSVRMLYLRALRKLREIWQTEFTSASGDS